MEKLYVPLMNAVLNDKNNAEYAVWLKKIKADCVFISLSRESLFMDSEEQAEYMQVVGENVRFYKDNGFGVGIWIESYGFGGRISDDIVNKMQSEPHITSVVGNVAGDAFCPEGEQIVLRNARRIQAIAKYAKPDMIMLDDELCLSVRPGLGCFCEKHLKLYTQKFKKEHTRDELKELIFTGNNEKYRKGWLEVVGDSMRNFCRKMRDALNEVDEEIRMGFCAGYTSWDIEGADAMELSKILAGNTNPFLRFTGAPYWVEGGRFGEQKLGEVIECVRLQEKWTEKSGIETFVECDTYPRPRYYVPFNTAEAFDVALRASGVNGSLKYLFCYDAPCDYETGYVKRHLKNMPLYAFIDEHFKGKTDVGVKVFGKQRKIENTVLPETFVGERPIMTNLFSSAAGFLSIQSIPTTYGEEYDSGIAFGTDVDDIERFPKKMIIDLDAALRLQNKGYDLGILSSEKDSYPVSEQFGENPPLSYQWGNTQYYRCELRKNIRLDSVFLNINGKSFPASYRHESNGTEFLVLCIDGKESGRNSHVFQSYYRQKQLLEFIDEPYPYIKGNPGIYTLCKEDEKEKAVLFVNVSKDEMFDFSIELGQAYSSFEMYGAEGVLDGEKIKIASTVPAYGAIALVLKK